MVSFHERAYTYYVIPCTCLMDVKSKYKIHKKTNYYKRNEKSNSVNENKKIHRVGYDYYVMSWFLLLDDSISTFKYFFFRVNFLVTLLMRLEELFKLHFICCRKLTFILKLHICQRKISNRFFSFATFRNLQFIFILFVFKL